MMQRGLQRSAVYLIRPDGYIGLATGDVSAATLIDYLDKHGIVLADRS